jgi:hypothetical protein
MVLVASSRSARTALPSEQNQPGRRLEQAAQPAGACRATFLGRPGATAACSVFPIMLPPFDPDHVRSRLPLLKGRLDDARASFKGINTPGLLEKRLLLKASLPE